jgi:heme exporter protein C
MYIHVATAWLAYLSFGVTALASVWWLIRRDQRADAVALAGAEVGVLFTASTIWAGMMWGRPVWGTFWDWGDPRLTTTRSSRVRRLPALRRLTDEPARRAGRDLGVVAAISIPIVHSASCGPARADFRVSGHHPDRPRPASSWPPCS